MAGVMAAAAAGEGSDRQAGRMIRTGVIACLLGVCTLAFVALIGDSGTGVIVLKQVGIRCTVLLCLLRPVSDA
eukprot:1036654-Rhodomonas_salina.2